MARPSGCSEPCSTPAATRSTSSAERPLEGQNLRDDRTADGERACLVDDERIDAARALERGGVAYETRAGAG